MKHVLLGSVLFYAASVCAQNNVIWSIGENNNSPSELALAPDGYKQFLANDFGYEDRYFLIGKSEAKKDFPYILPGPADEWGGTWSTSGWRTHDINILFNLKDKPVKGAWKLVVDLYDTQQEKAPKFKVTVNNQSFVYDLTTGGGCADSKAGGIAKEQVLDIPLDASVLKKGGNQVSLTILEGSWVAFDQVRLEGPKGNVALPSEDVFVRNVEAARYELDQNGKRVQPLLIDVEHLGGSPAVTVELNGKSIYATTLDTARYILEAPMPAVTKKQKGAYRVFADNKIIAEGTVDRTPAVLATAADYVDTRIGTAHSRWMIAPGPWMPFSMVKLSPDNQNAGWQAGYQPSFETVGCFSHIHEWTMGGLGMMPANGALKTRVGDEMRPDEGYRSRINKHTEEAPLGYYKVDLTDYDITAELTGTTRCGFQRYTFPKGKGDGRVLIDLQIPTEYNYNLNRVELKKVSDYRIEGFSDQSSPNVWSSDADQDYIIHFVIEFDKPIKKFGGWIDDKIIEGSVVAADSVAFAGAFVEFDTPNGGVVQARSGVSLVSIDNAALNLETEVIKPFGWNFEAVRDNQKQVWNELFNRVKITSDDKNEKTRFYSNMYRALCSRNIWSDVNGEWIDAEEKLQRFDDPKRVALGCDAFWNTFWNLNQFWNLITPEWSSNWVHSQLAMYDANGWLAKGPAGMEYIPVMVAEHEIPLVVAAYQMGIRDFDTAKAFEAVKKMQTVPGCRFEGGYAGNRDLATYLKHQYVPANEGRFSNSMEYSYDDWCVGQFAKSLNKQDEYATFNDRGYWWKHAIEPDSGYAHLRNADGQFVKDFDPFRSGANHHYVEGNAWQLTYFVPQDVPALAKMIGKQRFIDRLQWGFEASEPWRYNAPNDQYWDFPVVQGNQQSMHFAFLFNWVGEPWNTQRWSRSIIDRYYGSGIANAYLGDEDQGQMSAWFVMAAIGLFQTDGGASAQPVYEIASPLYEKVEIDLGERYGRGKTFTIEAKNASRKNKYVQKAWLNGKALNSFRFPASELLKGGSLVLEMSDKPNYSWGVEHE